MNIEKHTRAIHSKYKQLNDLNAAIGLAHTIQMQLVTSAAGRKLKPVHEALAYRLIGLHIEAERLRKDVQHLEGVQS